MKDIFTWEDEDWKVKKFLANSYDKNEYVIHKNKLKQVLNNWLMSKKVHKVIRFNQKWLKQSIDMNVDLRKAE